MTVPRHTVENQRWVDRLLEGAGGLGLKADAKTAAAAWDYALLLLKWNRSVNLTAITEPEQVLEKHILDSWSVARLGLPGWVPDHCSIWAPGRTPSIPLALLVPDLAVQAIDSIGKKVAFMKQAVASLSLVGRVSAAQVHLGGHPLQEGIVPAPWVVSRAFTDLERWLLLASPYLASGGRVIAMLAAEPKRLEKLIESHGYELQQVDTFQLPFSKAVRTLLVLQKIKK